MQCVTASQRHTCSQPHVPHVRPSVRSFTVHSSQFTVHTLRATLCQDVNDRGRKAWGGKEVWRFGGLRLTEHKEPRSAARSSVMCGGVLQCCAAFLLASVVQGSLTVMRTTESGLTDWCELKHLTGAYALQNDCGLHKLPGMCTVDYSQHSTAICSFGKDQILEIKGVPKRDGSLPRVYRKDQTQPYRLFTLHGGATLTIRFITLSGGDLSELATTAQVRSIGVGGGVLLFESSLWAYDSIISDHVATAFGGGGVFIDRAGNFYAIRTVIRNNSLVGGNSEILGGAGVHAAGTGSKAVLNASWVSSNHAMNVGGGLWCGRQSICSVVAQTVFTQNTANSSAGVYCNKAAFFDTDGTAFVNSPWCLPGTFGHQVGTLLTISNKDTQPANVGMCTECPPGTYSQTENADMCLPCATGTESHGGAKMCEAPLPTPHSVVPRVSAFPFNMIEMVLLSVASVVVLFLLYKTCVFCTLKHTGRLNPDMPLWKAFLFTILYGGSDDDHVLPDGLRRRLANVEMKDPADFQAGLLEGRATESLAGGPVDEEAGSKEDTYTLL